MTCPAGLKKATNYYNNIEARKDWNSLYEKAKRMNLFYEAYLLYPKPISGWRSIDRSIVELRKIMADKVAAKEVKA